MEKKSKKIRKDEKYQQQKLQKEKEKIQAEQVVLQVLTPEEEMQKLFGFSNFTSTKDKPHEETAVEGVRKNKQEKRKFRQYMNRRGGFNKPLESI